MTKKIKLLKKIKTKVIIALVVILLIVIIGFIYLDLVVNPIIVKIAEAEIDSVATTAVSDAIFVVVNDENIDYSDLVDIKYDSEGNVQSLVSNTVKMNYLARELSTKAQLYLDKIAGEGIAIPIGAFTGMPIFSDLGPDYNLKLYPIGSNITTFSSKFTSAGINQTMHSIYIDINASMSVILPTRTQKIEFVTSALVCETIIVGKIPSVYLSGGIAS